MDAIGLNSLLGGSSPDAAALQNIQNTLDDISDELRNVRTSIESLTKDVRLGNLESKLTTLKVQTEALDTLFKDQFTSVVSAAEAYAQSRENHESEYKQNVAFCNMIQKRDTFYELYDLQYPYGALPNLIHSFLVPGRDGASTTSILSSKGSLLLSENRYLTSATSGQVRKLYERWRSRKRSRRGSRWSATSRRSIPPRRPRGRPTRGPIETPARIFSTIGARRPSTSRLRSLRTSSSTAGRGHATVRTTCRCSSRCGTTFASSPMLPVQERSQMHWPMSTRGPTGVQRLADSVTERGNRFARRVHRQRKDSRELPQRAKSPQPLLAADPRRRLAVHLVERPRETDGDMHRR